MEKSKIDKLLKICLKRLMYERSTYQGFRSIQHFLSKSNSPDMLSGWMPLPATSLSLQWWYEMYVKYAVMVTGKKVNGGWLVDFQIFPEVFEPICQIDSFFVSSDLYFVDGSIISQMNKLRILWCPLCMVERWKLYDVLQKN